MSGAVAGHPGLWELCEFSPAFSSAHSLWNRTILLETRLGAEHLVGAPCPSVTNGSNLGLGVRTCLPLG